MEAPTETAWQLASGPSLREHSMNLRTLATSMEYGKPVLRTSPTLVLWHGGCSLPVSASRLDSPSSIAEIPAPPPLPAGPQDVSIIVASAHDAMDRLGMGRITMRAFLRILVVLPAVATGCASTNGVRYVYQDRDFGVVGVPENSDRWPTHYRRQAERLMASHFPDGHEIVRAEEVVEGSRTLKIEGSKTAELGPQLPREVVKVAKLGRTASRCQSDTLKIKECRIVYRRVSRAPEGAFADRPTLSPTQYLDPNDAERRKAAKDAEPGREPKAEKKAGDPPAEKKTG